MNYLLLFLHFIVLPATIIYTLVMGQFDLAIANVLAFLLLFIVWAVFRKK